MVEGWKIEVIGAKRCRNRRRISSSSEKEKNYNNNTTDNTDPDQAKGKYLVPRLDRSKATSD